MLFYVYLTQWPKDVATQRGGTTIFIQILKRLGRQKVNFSFSQFKLILVIGSNSKIFYLSRTSSLGILESWLLHYLKFTESKRTIDGWDRKSQHLDWVAEAVEFLTPPKNIDKKNYSGRTTGRFDTFLIGSLIKII